MLDFLQPKSFNLTVNSSLVILYYYNNPINRLYVITVEDSKYQRINLCDQYVKVNKKLVNGSKKLNVANWPWSGSLSFLRDRFENIEFHVFIIPAMTQEGTPTFVVIIIHECETMMRFPIVRTGCDPSPFYLHTFPPNLINCEKVLSLR